MAASLDVCGICLTEGVFGFCENCSVRICEKCFSLHGKVPLFTGHITFPFDALNTIANIQIQRENDIHEKKCSVHESEKQSLYCEKHEVPICGRCIRSDHRRCVDDIIDLHEVTFDEHQTNELTNSLKQLEEEISVIEGRVVENLKLNDKCKETCMKEITEYNKKLQDRLDCFREKAIKEVNVIHIKNVNKVRQVDNKCKEAKQRINEACSFINDLSHKKLERHLFVVSKRMGTDIEEIKTVIRQSNLENSIPTFSFLKNTAVDYTLQNDFTDIGTLEETCDGSEEVAEDTPDRINEPPSAEGDDRKVMCIVRDLVDPDANAIKHTLNLQASISVRRLINEVCKQFGYMLNTISVHYEKQDGAVVEELKLEQYKDCFLHDIMPSTVKRHNLTICELDNIKPQKMPAPPPPIGKSEHTGDSSDKDKRSMNNYFTQRTGDSSDKDKRSMNNYFTQRTGDSSDNDKRSLNNDFTQRTGDSSDKDKRSMNNYFTQRTGDSSDNDKRSLNNDFTNDKRSSNGLYQIEKQASTWCLRNVKTNKLYPQRGLMATSVQFLGSELLVVDGDFYKIILTSKGIPKLEKLVSDDEL